MRWTRRSDGRSPRRRGPGCGGARPTTTGGSPTRAPSSRSRVSRAGPVAAVRRRGMADRWLRSASAAKMSPSTSRSPATNARAKPSSPGRNRARRIASGERTATWVGVSGPSAEPSHRTIRTGGAVPMKVSSRVRVARTSSGDHRGSGTGLVWAAGSCSSSSRLIVKVHPPGRVRGPFGWDVAGVCPVGTRPTASHAHAGSCPVGRLRPVVGPAPRGAVAPGYLAPIVPQKHRVRTVSGVACRYPRSWE